MSKRLRVLISDSMSPRAAEVLAASSAVEVHDRSGLSAAELIADIGAYQGLIVRSRTQVTAAVIEAATSLEIIGRAGIGVDNIDVTAASRRGILVENAPSGNSVTTAEHGLCLLMALARHIPQASASMKAHKWEKSRFEGREIMGKTLGIVGLGNIGRIVADRARGLKMKVIAHDPFIGREAAQRLGVELVAIGDLFKRADFITIHAPLTAETRGIVGKDAFATMKPGVLIVNAARGGIIDEAALLEALESDKVAGAAIDVFEIEPPAADNPLVAHPRVICTPHLGASTEEAQEKVAVEVAEQLVAYAERGEVRNAINMISVPQELRSQLLPWTELSRSLGALVAQLARGGERGFIDRLSVEVTGEPAELGTTACTNATLVGLLETYMDVPVNQVNASVIAADRGLDVTEVKRSHDRDLTSSIAVSAHCGDVRRVVKGTLYHIGDRVEPRVVQIDDFLVEATPSGTILVVLNEDRPGVIGAVGTLVGERGINVNSLHVGLDSKKGIAIALWNLDGAITDELLNGVRSLSLVNSAKLIHL